MRHPDGQLEPQPPPRDRDRCGGPARRDGRRRPRSSGSSGCSSRARVRARDAADHSATSAERPGTVRSASSRVAVSGAAAAVRGAGRSVAGAADARAPAAQGPGRLLDERRDAARARAGRAAARDRRAARRRAGRAARRRARTGRGRRARASSTCCCPTSGTAARCADVLEAGDAVRRRRRRPGGADPDRVRLRQSDRPAGRGERPPRRLRRCAGADPRAPRPRGHARVLLQRRRQPDPAAGRVGAARARGEEVPEGGYQGDYVADLARSIPGAAATRASTSWPRRAVELLLAADQGHARSLRGPLRRLLQRADAARGLAEPARARAGLARGGRPRLPLRGRDVAADDDLRRRQGPGGRPLQRRADLPRRRHRLHAEQARARVRAPARSRSGPTTPPTCAR